MILHKLKTLFSHLLSLLVSLWRFQKNIWKMQTGPFYQHPQYFCDLTQGIKLPQGLEHLEWQLLVVYLIFIHSTLVLSWSSLDPFGLLYIPSPSPLSVCVHFSLPRRQIFSPFHSSEWGTCSSLRSQWRGPLTNCPSPMTVSLNPVIYPHFPLYCLHHSNPDLAVAQWIHFLLRVIRIFPCFMCHFKVRTVICTQYVLEQYWLNTELKKTLGQHFILWISWSQLTAAVVRGKFVR